MSQEYLSIITYRLFEMLPNITYIPISDLPTKYKVSHQTIYNQMKFLKISTTKMERKYYC